jgi:hypothetical protein
MTIKSMSDLFLHMPKDISWPLPRGINRRGKSAKTRQRLGTAVIAHFEAAPPFASEILRARNRP